MLFLNVVAYWRAPSKPLADVQNVPSVNPESNDVATTVLAGPPPYETTFTTNTETTTNVEQLVKILHSKWW